MAAGGAPPHRFYWPRQHRGFKSMATQLRCNREQPVSLMQAQGQEELKYPKTTLLKSSNDLGWSTLFAELRSHSHYEGTGAAAPTDAEVGIIVRGSDQGLLTYKFAGTWQSVQPTMGSIRLRRSDAPTTRSVSAVRRSTSYTYTCPPSPLRR
jgi:hypothetical protein